MKPTEPAVLEEFARRRKLLGRCECKGQCAREQGYFERPNRTGVCDVEAPHEIYLEQDEQEPA